MAGQTAAAEVNGGSYTLKGIDGPVTVPPGEWYINTKARCQMLTRNTLTGEARRVYAVLELHTMGFRQELAVIMRKNGKTYPLTTTDLEQETGMKGAAIRRTLDELESQGLAERRAMNPQKPLQKGNVKIYSWATPQPLKEPRNTERAYSEKMTSVPESMSYILAFLKRKRIPVPDFESLPDEKRAQFERIARELENLEEEARELAKTCPPTKPAGSLSVDIIDNGERKAPDGQAKHEKYCRTWVDPQGPCDCNQREPSPMLPLASSSANKGAKARLELERWLNAHSSIGTKVDREMLDKIARALEEPDLLEQFKTEALKIAKPRKYAVYLAVARQVAARGRIAQAREPDNWQAEFIKRHTHKEPT